MFHTRTGRRAHARPLLISTIVLAVTLVGSSARSGDPPKDPVPAGAPLSPGEALQSFRLEPGLRIELVAAEPMVVSPVACAFDARGRLYVAENRGYPTGPGEGKPPVGRIALLEDRDGDGRMDRRTEFAHGLTFPNGVMPWKDGLIVTCAPDVIWLHDADGDGQADERKVLFTGFSMGGSTQLRVSHPTLSVDNWIYLTSGLTGGWVKSPEHPEHRAVVLGRTDFRFRPDGRTFEPADGGSQFGLTFDDFGHRFICYNRVQVQHVVIPSAVLRRNPHLAFSQTVQDCPAEMAPEPLKGHGAAARLYPISRNVTTADSHAGTFTAACAVTVFRGTGLPDAHRGGAFSCDPTGNLVHFDRLEPAGATFTARRARAGVEVLASTDDWFRPVFLAQGPDGALYVCDMYRKTIEHPDYLPVEVRKRTDFEAGKTMGRIWRVVRDDAKSEDLKRLRRVNLADATVPQLCAAILDRDGWHRDSAHRLLLERADPEARAALSTIVTDPASPAASVVHALRLLEALGGLTDDLVRRSLNHRSPGVRENALQLAEARLRDQPSWLDEVLALADDRDPHVRFQAAIALGSARTSAGDHDPVPGALARIAARDGHDRWLRAAVFSSLSGRESRFLEALRRLAGGGTTLALELLTEFGRMLPLSAPREEWPNLVRLIVDRGGPVGFPSSDQAALLTGLGESVRGKLASAAGGDILAALAGGDTRLAASLHTLVDAMASIALDPSAEVDRRRAAVGLLGFAGFDRAGEALLRLIEPAQPAALQAGAVRALGTQRDPRIASALLASGRFAAYTPSVRDEVLSALLAQSAHVPGVLDAVGDGRVPAGAIDAGHRRQLARHPDPAIRRRAASLFGTVSGDRAKVFEAYKDVVSLPPDPARGRAVFRRECAQCHRLDQEGHAVGPDLFGIRNQPKETILLHILVPDHEITAGFAAYTIATRDGRVLTGLIASETPSSITLRQALGQEDTIPRDEIDQVSAGKQSLMPQGFEKSISRQEFADLLAYLKGEAAGPK
jgi:putative membrane-bound dehydrogenase-like protein